MNESAPSEPMDSSSDHELSSQLHKQSSSSHENKPEDYNSYKSATCTITPSGVHISQRSLLKKDVPSVDNNEKSSISISVANDEPMPFQSNENSFQNNENGRISSEDSGNDSDQLYIESNCEESNTPESSDAEANKSVQNNCPKKLTIKEVPPTSAPPPSSSSSLACSSESNKNIVNHDNAPLDLCVKPVNTKCIPVPSSIITKQSNSSLDCGPPSIKVLPIYSSNSSDKKSSSYPKASSIIGKSNDPLTITRIAPSGKNGLDKIVKHRHKNLLTITEADKKKHRLKQCEKIGCNKAFERSRNRRFCDEHKGTSNTLQRLPQYNALSQAAAGEPMKRDIEAEVKLHNDQLTLAKKLSLTRYKSKTNEKTGENITEYVSPNHSPKKSQKQRLKPTIVNINSEPLKQNTKSVHNSSCGNAIEISIRTTSPTHKADRHPASSNDDSSGSSSNDDSGSSSGSDSGSDEEGSTHSDETGNSSFDGTKKDQHNTSGLARKRYVTDEKELRIPLGHGWKRQTRIRCFSVNSVRGEVSYFAPCGKKLKTYPEVVRYLEKAGITNLSRENFSFSSKYNVGDFLEPVGDSQLNEYNLVSDSEIKERLNKNKPQKPSGAVKRKRGRPPLQIGKDGVPLIKQQARKSVESEKNNSSSKRGRKKLCDKSVTIKEVEKSAAADAKHKDQVKIIKLQETLDLQRKQQELKAQQMIEEIQKQREILMALDMERERRRQHMLLVKALENQKKQEEQRQVELKVLTEMKKPVDDMEIKNQRDMPTLSRVPGLKITGQAFGNILLAYEFLHNFGETLGFQDDQLPTLNTLQMSLVNDEECEEELVLILQQLFKIALDDPGLPMYPKTLLGQSIRDVVVTSSNITEVLRLYFYAHSGVECKMHKLLKTHSFFALSPTQKSDILAFFCDEITGSRLINREVDNSLDTIANYRKDKWIVEGELRRYRTLHAKKRFKLELSGKPPNLVKAIQGEVFADKKDNDSLHSTPGKDDDNISANESDDAQETIQPPVPDVIDDGDMNLEDINKKIDQLSVQWKDIREKFQKTTASIRALSYGQDRFRRRYWALPSCGGIYVESMESCEPPGGDNFYSPIPSNDVTDSDKKSDVTQKQDENNSSKETPVNDKPDNNIQAEAKDEKPNNKVVENLKQEAEQDEQKKADVKSSEGKVENCESASKSSEPTKSANKVESMEIDEKPAEEKETADVEMKDVSANQHVENEVSSSKAVELIPVTNDKNAEKPAVKIEIESRPKVTLEVTNGDKELDLSTTSRVKKEADPPQVTVHKVNSPAADKPNIPTSDAAFGAMNYAPFLDPKLFMNKDLNNAALLGMFGQMDPAMQTAANANPFAANILASMYGMKDVKDFASSSADAKPWFSLLPRAPCDDTTLINNNQSVKTSEAVAAMNLAHSTANNLQAFAGNFASMPVMNFANGSNFLAPGLFNPAQFNSPFGSVFQPMMMPTMNFNAASNSFYPATTMASVVDEAPAATSVNPSEVNVEKTDPEVMQAVVLERLRQYDQPQPIPTELQRGWWRITDEQQVRAVVKALHSRGVRERLLYKNFDKYMENAIESLARGKGEETDLTVTDKDEEISKMVGGALEPEVKAKMNIPAAIRAAVIVLEQVEAMEDRVFSASMHVKSWRLPNKFASNDSIEMEFGQQDNLDEICSLNPKLIESDENESSDDKKEANEEIDKNEKSSTKKECKKKEKDDNDNDEGSQEKTKICPILLTQRKLRNLEVCIERRYLKHPLARHVRSHQVVTSTSFSEDDIPNGLNNWRNAVCKAKSSSQLAMCLQMLTKCVAWDKSIMKASCQFCHSGDNEEMLLLCDNCDKGYHTYCFKPEMDKIPEGDWFCYQCLNRGSSDKVCCLCGNKGKQMISCDACPKVYHLDCLELNKSPRGRWNCPCCNFRPNNRKRKPGRKQQQENKEVKENKETKEPVEQEEPKEQKTSKMSEKKKAKMINALKNVMTELEKHEDAWPFLLPVDTKQFTTYKKIIKKPMDLSTVRSRLQEGQYKCKEDFTQDVTLIFDNCETFNEDDSPVGKAGHKLRSFFKTCMASE